MCIGFECVLSTFPSATLISANEFSLVYLSDGMEHGANIDTPTTSRFVPANFISAPSPAHGAFGSKLNISNEFILFDSANCLMRVLLAPFVCFHKPSMYRDRRSHDVLLNIVIATTVITAQYYLRTAKQNTMRITQNMAKMIRCTEWRMEVKESKK